MNVTHGERELQAFTERKKKAGSAKGLPFFKKNTCPPPRKTTVPSRIAEARRAQHVNKITGFTIEHIRFNIKYYARNKTVHYL
jgi:hypothetical protein